MNFSSSSVHGYSSSGFFDGPRCVSTAGAGAGGGGGGGGGYCGAEEGLEGEERDEGIGWGGAEDEEVGGGCGGEREDGVGLGGGLIISAIL